MPLAMTLLLAAAAAVPAPASDGEIVVRARAARAIDAPIIPDRELAKMRGGLLLANGLDISIGVDIQTRVDGALVLHTIYASDGPSAGVRVFTDGRDAPRTAPGTTTIGVPGSQGEAAITVDRSPTGTTISVGGASQGTTINLVNADPSQWLMAAGQTPVPVTEGAPVTQGPGTFSLATDDRGAVVTLDAATLQIQHLIGQATGVIVANTANDRSIDTISSINVDLQGISPSLFGSLFTADQLAFDAMSRR